MSAERCLGCDRHDCPTLGLTVDRNSSVDLDRQAAAEEDCGAHHVNWIDRARAAEVALKIEKQLRADEVALSAREHEALNRRVNDLHEELARVRARLKWDVTSNTSMTGSASSANLQVFDEWRWLDGPKPRRLRLFRDCDDGLFRLIDEATTSRSPKAQSLIEDDERSVVFLTDEDLVWLRKMIDFALGVED